MRIVIDEESPHILYIDESVARAQTAKLKALRARRSNEEVERRLEALKRAAAKTPAAGINGNISDANTMPYIVDKSIKQAFTTQSPVALILSPLLTGGNPLAAAKLK